MSGHHHRPDRAGEIVAAGGERHGEPAPSYEPVRHVGNQRTEDGRRAGADQQALDGGELPDRIRCGGKQVVRYIGGADRADIVKQELSILQAESRIKRELNARVKIANRMLREAKRTPTGLPLVRAHP